MNPLLCLAIAIPLNFGTIEMCERYTKIANSGPKSDAQLQRLVLMHDMCIDALEADTSRDVKTHCVTAYQDNGETTTVCNFYLKERGYENAEESNSADLGITSESVEVHDNTGRTSIGE